MFRYSDDTCSLPPEIVGRQNWKKIDKIRTKEICTVKVRYNAEKNLSYFSYKKSPIRRLSILEESVP
jgi:hypothetical protein